MGNWALTIKGRSAEKSTNNDRDVERLARGFVAALIEAGQGITEGKFSCESKGGETILSPTEHTTPLDVGELRKAGTRYQAPSSPADEDDAAQKAPAHQEPTEEKLEPGEAQADAVADTETADELRARLADKLPADAVDVAARETADDEEPQHPNHG